MRKAVIKLDNDNQTKGKVYNIIECSDSGIDGIRFPNGYTIWDCTQYAVKIGDDWENGVYTSGDKNVPYIPSTEEKLIETQQEVSNLEDSMLSLMDTMVTMM